jgi:monothiol glutaredoxin
VQCLDASGAEYAAMDILPDPRIRQQLSAHSGWPTIPQLFIDGELVGGCDIITELYQNGELSKMVAPAA